MSFHEKSAWACLVSIVVVYVPYAWVISRHPWSFLGLFPVAVVAQILLLVVFHAANALMTRSIRVTGKVPPPDELEQHIELTAAKFAGFVLAFIVMSWCLVAMAFLPAEGFRAVTANGGAHEVVLGQEPHSPARMMVSATDALVGIHGLFLGFVLANLAYYGGIVLGYRRLAHE